ncbi:MAG TPA: Ig-like domain-containing protein [Burkholderiales bacterium]|nr:Ig-like domain-containing protein [Burkholderiales bacterium]
MAALAGTLMAAGGPASARFDIPTGAAPSPLFGAQPFSQRMLRFEEFGLRPLPDAAPEHLLPDPLGCDGPSFPEAYSTSLDTFLSQPLSPAPTRQANTGDGSPWAGTISGCLGRPLTGVLEGRPPGENFAHQRWEEFPPQAYFQTAQAGARSNGGIRDALQRHSYSVGEFAPGGLYHNTVGPETAAALGVPLPAFDGTTRGIAIRFHPLMPVQDPLSLWTFDGTLPPKLLLATYGTPVLLRHYNALPVSEAANRGFGKHTLSTHEHNGHNPGESDGFAGAYFFPGQFYDYRWPMVLAGHDSVNTAATDPRAGAPDGQGGIRTVRGDWRETMSTHWFHDHMVDYTAQNVYKGNAAMMNYYSALDRGREPATPQEAAGSADRPGYGCHYADSANVNLCLPSGSGLDWGNRDYDVNLLVADKAFDAQGQLFFNVFNTDGFLGDVLVVNFLYKPYMDVRARKYRFRILNGSVSRYFKIALVDQTGAQVPFHLIANDGNLMEHAIRFPNVQSPEGLPEQAIAERYDIIVDFSRFREGDRLYFVNLLEHDDGKGPKQAIPLAQVLSGAYSAGGCPESCDPAVGKFMEFRVRAMQAGQSDLSMNPADYEPGGKKMVPLPGFTAEELANAKERTFEFGRSGGTDQKPWTIRTDGGDAFNATDVEGLVNRLSAAPERGSVEIWHIINGGEGWSHPVHIHFEEGQILQRGGVAPPLWERWARKDVYRIGPLPDSTDRVTVAMRVREFQGTYVEHCHNTQHEDTAMLLRWDSQNPGQLVPIQSPFPSWDGVTYVATNTTDVPTYKSGLATDFLANVAAPLAANDTASTRQDVPLRVAVLDNDSCVGACDPASLLIGTPPANGTATRNADGTVTYAPAAGFAGTDSFTYTVRDTTTGTRVSNPASVALTVVPAALPPAPVAVNDAATTVAGTVTGINVIANDTNCPPCTVTIVAPPLHGTAVANSPGAGEVTYTPAAGYVGADSFTYTASNAGGSSGPANVAMTVAPNPVTDVVTIATANRNRNGGLNSSGTVSRLNNAFAPTVEVFAGALNASATACTGVSLGTAPVSGRNGRWSFAARNLGPAPRLCVKSANGGVADAPL